MPISFVQNDISKVRADVLVNAANSALAPGGGVCGALFRAAGFQQMQSACRAIGHCPTGRAVVTDAFALPARWVVHAVGPVWRGGRSGERELLFSAYRSVFDLVGRLGARSVALPLISAGIYGYPMAESLALAGRAAREFLAGRPDVEVTIVVYDRAAFAGRLREFRALAAYLGGGENGEGPASGGRGRSDSLGRPEFASLGEEAAGPWLDDEEGPVSFGAPASAVPAPEADALRPPSARGTSCARMPLPSAARERPAGPAPCSAASEPKPRGRINSADLSERLRNLDASFSQAVLALIDARGLTDAEVYRRANISRQLFSKLRRDARYRPSKQTAVALAFALELDLDQTLELLGRAGYTLGHASKFDVIVEYFLVRGCHDVFELNQMLFSFDQPLVGSV